MAEGRWLGTKLNELEDGMENAERRHAPGDGMQEPHFFSAAAFSAESREPRMTPVGGRPYLTRYSLSRQALVAIRQMAVGTVAQTRPPM